MTLEDHAENEDSLDARLSGKPWARKTLPRFLMEGKGNAEPLA
jgi:hypothetical protein